MTYELAKQLKDVGFPQKEHGWGYFIGKQSDAPICSPGIVIPLDGVAYVPTLSELIEACGDRFWRMFQNHPDDYKIQPGLRWSVYGIGTGMIDGATPEEAVAKLWLALNKKQ